MDRDAHPVVRGAGEHLRQPVRLVAEQPHGRAGEQAAGEGLVEVDHEEVVDSRLRRYYRLTPVGAERLAVEAERRRSQAGAALRRLRAGGASA